jgi:hypothetical protein
MARSIALKMAAALCFVFLALAVIVAYQSPAAGYELSTYADTPVLVWVLVLLSLVGGIGIVIHELAAGRYQESRTYLIGFAVALLTVIVFLSLPFVRSYFTWRGDHIGHLGYVEDIFSTGHIGPVNPYPIVHVLFFQIASVTGASVLSVVNLNTALLVPVFVLNIYLLATVALPDRGQRLLVALIAGVAMVGISSYYLIPNTWSLAMLPLVFYCYFKHETFPFKVLLAVLVIAYPFFHPLSALVVIGALTVMELLRPLYSIFLRRRDMQVPSWVDSKPLLWPVLLGLAVFVPWVQTRDILESSRINLWEQLTTGRGPGEISEIGTALAKVEVHGVDLVALLGKMYGAFLLLAALALVGILLLVRQLPSGDRNSNKHRLLFLGVLFIIACLYYVAFVVGIPGAEAIAADRTLLYVEVAGIALAAFALWEWSRRARFRHFAWSGIFCLLLLVSILSISSHFFSPYVLRPNDQATQADIAGMKWYLDEKDPSVPAIYIMSPPRRFAEAVLGTTPTQSRIDFYLTQFSDHFGYNEYGTLGEQYRGPVYGTINKFDKVVYQTVWQKVDRFNDADFRGLEQDSTVSRIYSNGAMDCLYVTPYPQIAQVESPTTAAQETAQPQEAGPT